MTGCDARKAVLALASLFWLVALPVALAQSGYGGTIHYRDGVSVEFEWLGDLAGPRRAFVGGLMGSRSVEIDLTDLQEIIFAEPTKPYHNQARYRGQMIVVNRAGERFNLDAFFEGGFGTGYVHYVLQDPISGELKATRDAVLETIASVTIGDFVGEMKFNPSTEEFFPPTFVFDPYTGGRLIWRTP